MIRKIAFLVLCALTVCPVSAQIHLPGFQEKLINPALYEGYWSAQWIGVPSAKLRDYGVYHFRKTIQLETVPQTYVIHVSADNRYKLFVNDSLVSLGPCRGDLSNWNFETLDIARFLKVGKNTLAAVVWFYGQACPAAQISQGDAAFLVQGNTEKEKEANTNNSWKCIQDEAYSISHAGKVNGYYAAGPTEQVDVANYPEDWERSNFDDSSWKQAQVVQRAAMKGAIDYPGRLLVPRFLPPMEMTRERLQSVRRMDGIKTVGDFLKKPVNLTIPAGSTVTLLLDQGKETTGYPTLLFGGGKGAEVTIGYAEALFSSNERNEWTSSGNRNDIEGKEFIGYADRVLADGRATFNYTPLWWRTWRYVQLTVKTKDEPLVLKDFYGTFSAYPYQRVSRFSAKGDRDLEKILDIGWHTARLCANETYMDCPYYEQLQYFGDTRIQTMVSMYNTADMHLVKSALEMGRRAMLPDGLTYSRYPTSTPQIISSYSLSWTGMVYDYWMYRGDEAYVKTLLPQIRQVLSWYEQWLQPDGSLSSVPYWFFCDWAAGYPGGMPIREKEGHSAYQDLVYLMALDEVAKMEAKIGIPALAQHDEELAQRIRVDFKKKYWDEKRGLFADTYDHRNFSQHTNIMAILTDIVKGDAATQLCHKMLTDKGITQGTIYFRYYLLRAMNHAGLSGEMLDQMGIWRKQLTEGMTTWAEEPEPTRSDCHAWGASPNVELFRTFLGIDTEAPGFGKVKIAPALGHLREASGTIAHPQGLVSVDYKISKAGRMKASVELPESVSGRFIWNGHEYPLHGGAQTIDAE
ncbi:MAG: alpha-L-rhamnosidase C-terminal domain-containing protein [Bacteroidaceae bacterium]